MKTIINFFLFFTLFCLPAVAQRHTVKIQSPEYIQVTPSETVFEVEEGSDLLLEVKFLPVCFGADLGVTVNGENVEPIKIDQENFEVNIEKVTEDIEVVLSVMSTHVEGEIGYDEVTKYTIFYIPYQRDVSDYIHTGYESTDNGWSVLFNWTVEAEPSLSVLRNDEDIKVGLYVWPVSLMSPDTEYYVKVEYFRRYKGAPIIIHTITSPVFTVNNYLTSNIPVSESLVAISTEKSRIHIQADLYPCQARIYTITGKLVKSIQLNANKTTISIPPGMYIVVIGDETCKVVVE